MEGTHSELVHDHIQRPFHLLTKALGKIVFSLFFSLYVLYTVIQEE